MHLAYAERAVSRVPDEVAQSSRRRERERNKKPGLFQMMKKRDWDYSTRFFCVDLYRLMVSLYIFNEKRKHIFNGH